MKKKLYIIEQKKFSFGSYVDWFIILKNKEEVDALKKNKYSYIQNIYQIDARLIEEINDKPPIPIIPFS